jgi:cysteine desulfurase/selenocysteine lyase
VKLVESREPIEAFRDDFPVLQRRRNGKPAIYLDNACTTLVPRQVIESINEYYNNYPSCGGGRSRHWFADEVNSRLEGNSEKGITGARRIIVDFIHAKSEKEIIFTLNTTHAINTVALGFRFRTGDVVLLSDKEHNSNLVPWLRLQKKGQINIEYLRPNNDEEFDLEAFKEKLETKRIRLVSMGYTSNVTGSTVPAKEITRIAHRHGASVLLDGAQMVPHKEIDVQDLDVDFLAFSMHKMCGPRGVGVLYGKKELLGQGADEGDCTVNGIESVILGGGTVSDSHYDFFSLLDGPDSFEAGTHNYPAQIASGTAVRYLQQIGMGRIGSHVGRLNSYLTKELLSRYGNKEWFRILGPRDPKKRGGVLSFEVRRPNAVGIAQELSRKNNIMIRDGAFCAHSYFNNKFGKGWTRPRSHNEHRMVYRVSFYFYNTIEECAIFLESLDDIFKERCYI